MFLTSAGGRGIADLHKALSFGAWGAGGGAAGAFIAEALGIGGRKQEWAGFSELVIEVGIWFAIIGALIALGILLGQEKYGGRPLPLAVRGSIARRLVVGTAFGGLSGFVAGAIAQALYTGIGATEALRVICWGVAGGSLGFALSFRIPNLTRSRGLTGGFAGGIVGGLVFIAINLVGSQVFARLLGIAAIGFAIGLMIVVADALFRKAWLEVRYGPNEARTLTLGTEPVRIGSDVHCEVYVANVPAIAYAYRFENGQLLCEDPLNHRNDRVVSGVPNIIGRITVIPWAVGEQGRQEVIENSSFTGPQRHENNFKGVLELADGRQFSLGSGERLSTTQIRGLEPAGDDGSVAEISPHPSEPGVLGLKNLSQKAWRATLASGRQVQIDPGRSIRLDAGVRIDFGAAEGTIR
jgi:hypothetical protein